MLKLAAIIGGVLLMGGVAFAGTRTLLEQTSGPTLGTTLQLPAAPATTRQEDRGRENEVRGRENEVGEDLRGPCDEPEHANDPRCTGLTFTPTAELDEDGVADDRGDDDNRGRSANSGPGDRSGDDDGDHDGHSGHGGGGDDD